MRSDDHVQKSDAQHRQNRLPDRAAVRCSRVQSPHLGKASRLMLRASVVLRAVLASSRSEAPADGPSPVPTPQSVFRVLFRPRFPSEPIPQPDVPSPSPAARGVGHQRLARRPHIAVKAVAASGAAGSNRRESRQSAALRRRRSKRQDRPQRHKCVIARRTHRRIICRNRSSSTQKSAAKEQLEDQPSLRRSQPFIESQKQPGVVPHRAEDADRAASATAPAGSVDATEAPGTPSGTCSAYCEQRPWHSFSTSRAGTPSTSIANANVTGTFRHHLSAAAPFGGRSTSSGMRNWVSVAELARRRRQKEPLCPFGSRRF